jgi:TRAP-type C4-dicarboxylate transport system permease small subunit
MRVSDLGADAADRDQPIAVVNWPIGIMYAVVLAGFVLMTWRAAQVALLNFRRGASVLKDPERADFH